MPFVTHLPTLPHQRLSRMLKSITSPKSTQERTRPCTPPCSQTNRQARVRRPFSGAACRLCIGREAGRWRVQPRTLPCHSKLWLGTHLPSCRGLPANSATGHPSADRVGQAQLPAHLAADAANKRLQRRVGAGSVARLPAARRRQRPARHAPQRPQPRCRRSPRTHARSLCLLGGIVKAAQQARVCRHRGDEAGKKELLLRQLSAAKPPCGLQHRLFQRTRKDSVVSDC